ncbi:uncharacterized protein DUF1876 [Kribbella steppae]|uniref:Uncharacterized protein DUF1876 n=1 Tax=Kribbella steppae TaxID=2512223 RepID=A0A4R2HGV5_9ACTN|nr:DUF1876 domain-containing protein [Kribbella steppae]TCO28119.1 uncharacterized protein DUF1876 [Kribbella steppae]
MTVRQWTVDIMIDEVEDERTTHAEARLRTDGEQIAGRGTAYRHPNDVEVPQIGDELAAARALSELSHRLVLAAAQDIEETTHRPSRLRG